MSKKLRILDTSSQLKTPVAAAITQFIEAESYHYKMSVAEDESLLSGDETSILLSAEHCSAAAEIARRKLETVTEMRSSGLSDVIMKMKLWLNISGLSAMSKTDLNPSERLISSITHELESLVKSQ